MSDLAGKTFLVTGASSGIGMEAAIKFARRGADVVLTARDRTRAEAALAEVKSRSSSQKVSLLLHDLSTMAGVRALAAEFRATHKRLDVLVNNAGGVSDRRRVTADGFEQTFAVNHLAPFLLTNLLLDMVKASAPSRVVVVASIGHRRGTMDFEDLQFEKGGYAIMSSYGRSKLANILFANELARRVAGTGVVANSLHPGAVSTNIWSKAPWFTKPLLSVAKLFMISPEQGGDTIVHVAASPETATVTGTYFEKNKPAKPTRPARDEAIAKRLWDVSEKLTGLA
jgi:NAD(P)-dependent dehydrogenase (short-subunit alcohol dehydrogenase family)